MGCSSNTENLDETRSGRTCRDKAAADLAARYDPRYKPRDFVAPMNVGELSNQSQ